MHDKSGTYHKFGSGYVSEFTQFIDTFLKEHPDVVEDQHTGWNIFWDHDVDFDALSRADGVPFIKTMPASTATTTRQEKLR